MTTKRNDNDGAGERGFASGCLGIFFEVIVWVVSTTLVTIGAVLFLFGVTTFEGQFGVGTILALVVAPVAIILFIRTGRAILHDLRNQK